MASSATQVTAYARCRCGCAHRLSPGETRLCECLREVSAPGKRVKAPDVVLPRM